MKRIISLILVSAMIVSSISLLASCNGEGEKGGYEGNYDFDEVYEVLPDDTFEGATFNVLCAAEEWKEKYVVEEQSDVLKAAQYNMYNKIMEKYDVDIQHRLYGGFMASLDTVRDALYQSVVSGSLDFDLIAGGQDYVYERVGDGTLLNLEETGIDFSAEWWCQYVNEDLKVCGVLPLATGYYSLTAMSASMCIFYNPTVAETYNLKNIYDVVRSGDWTYETFTQYCKAVMTDVNGDGNYSADEDIVGNTCPEFFRAQITIASGYPITIHNDDGTISINNNTEKLFEITTRIHDLVDNKLSVASSDDVVNFAQGRALTTINELACADLQEVRNMPEYTVVPMFKYDTAQSEYITPTIADVCGIPLNVKNQIMSEDIMEALNCFSYYECKDVYLNLILKDKYSKDKDTEEMIDLILKNQDTEFAHITAQLFGTDLFFCTVWKGRNIASWLKSYKKVYETKLEKYYEKLYDTYD